MGIREEWNEIAKKRLFDRLEGNDISYNEVLLPLILNSIKSKKKRINSILDFGCGTGELTYEVSKLDIPTIGLDISKYSIELAKKYFQKINLKFTDKSLSDMNFENEFDLIVANMSLMDTANIEENFKKLYLALKPGGTFLITLTHSCFWPIYWDYFDNDNFKYLAENKITKTYRTSETIFNGFKTTHYHRPISFYINLFISTKIKIKEMKEMEGPKLYKWYPRFIYFRLEK